MNLYLPKEIAEKLGGITTRQITDMVEKGIIVPAEKSTGRGSSRRYSKENVLEIAVAIATRHIFSVEETKHIVKMGIRKKTNFIYIKKNPETGNPSFFSMDEKPNHDMLLDALKIFTLSKRQDYSTDRKLFPIDFLVTYLDIGSIRNLINERF